MTAREAPVTGAKVAIAGAEAPVSGAGVSVTGAEVAMAGAKAPISVTEVSATGLADLWSPGIGERQGCSIPVISLGAIEWRPR